VTVLFADLVGFTARAEQLDPEDVRALISPYYTRLRRELERFGGTVEKFIGDAVMAVFGAPVAHEDDPERAVRAAIEIRDWIAAAPDDLQVRIAVNTGEALVSLGARPSEGEGMVAGDVVNTAARMQAAAPVNGILIGERTRRAASYAIDCREHEPVVGKGKTEPIAVWEVVAARHRLGVDLVRHEWTPLVGRARELEMLTSTLNRVREEDSAQLVTVAGAPGIGKSRLVYELSCIVDADPELITWRQGRCLPYGEGVSFWALGEMVKAQAGIRENDAPREVEAKLTSAVGHLLIDEAERTWVTSQLRPLVGLPVESSRGDSESEASSAWRRFLEAIAERGPTIIVFEDLHWADDGLLDFIDSLAERSGGIPLFVLCTARPELLQRRSSWGGGKANALTISLPALRDDETQQLLTTLLGGASLAPRTVADLLVRTGGNPLYAEQYARMLAERGELGELPETVQGIIAARIDALPMEEKTVVRESAVIGKVFWLGATMALGDLSRGDAEAALLALERKDFVQRARASSVEGETEYAFRHVLLRDVAYGEIPRRERAVKHERAADWLELMGASEDLADMLAHHYSSALSLAGGPDNADAALVAKAREALTRAADRARLLGSSAAAHLYAEAIELCEPDDPERLRLMSGRGRALVMSDESPAGLAILLEVLEESRARGDVESAAEAASAAGRAYWFAGDRKRSDEYIELGLSLLVDRPPSRAKLETLVQQTSGLMMAGEFTEAIRVGDETMQIATELGLEDSSQALRIRVAVGTTRAGLGDREGMSEVKRAITAARESGQMEAAVLGINNLSSVKWSIAGELEEAARLRREYTDMARRYGFTRLVNAGESELLAYAFVEGRWDDALADADEWIDRLDAGRSDYADAAVLSVRAAIRLGRDDTDGAVSDAQRAVEIARGSDLQAQAQAYTTASIVALEVGAVGEAEPLVSEFPSMAPEIAAALNFPYPTLVEVAWAFRGVGRLAELRSFLETMDALKSPWVDAAWAVARDEPIRAASILDEIGHPASAAYCRLRAAEAGEADQGGLKSALDFYRHAGATRYAAAASRT
jgi:class 3 adenylate cyclase